VDFPRQSSHDHVIMYINHLVTVTEKQITEVEGSKAKAGRTFPCRQRQFADRDPPFFMPVSFGRMTAATLYFVRHACDNPLLPASMISGGLSYPSWSADMVASNAIYPR